MSFRFTCCLYTVRSPNALRATVESGFLSARYGVRVVMFAPVEYLTYGSRKRRRVFRLPRRTAVHVSASPFIDLKYATVQTKLREKSKKGASALFLVVLRGIAKAGLPRESSEAIRVGKGGTTKRTRPAACGRVRDVKFVPTQTPPLPFSFYRQRLFLCRAKKKGLKPASRTPCAYRQ